MTLVVRAVLGSVSDQTGIPVEAIMGRSRCRRVARARQIAAWVLCELGFSTVNAGRALGRDHTTILHAQAVVDADPDLKAVAQAVYALWKDRVVIHRTFHASFVNLAEAAE